MTAVLETRNLNKTFGAVTAAANVNVAIDKDEVVALIGSNGAGKTTFVNMVTGYLRPTSGIILFQGADITGKPPRHLSRIGICRSFQIAQLFQELTTLENMLLASAAIRIDRTSFVRPMHNAAASRRALEILDTFGIAEHAQAQVRTLAQGMRKLLDIAMAMVSRPALLLLDEPTSGVAIDEKFALMDTVMSGVKAFDSTILFIEHDTEIVSRYASRVIAFYNGTVLIDAAPAAALADPQVRQYIVGSIHAEAPNRAQS